MTASMALVDYIPVFLFLVTSIILQRDLYNKMSKGAFALFCAGTMMVFFAGFFKATWKLLYALNVCDFFKLNYCMMPMQSTGFFLTAAALIAMLYFNQGDTEAGSSALAVAAAPAAYTGTGIFIAMMCSGIGVISFCLSVLAVRLKKSWLIAVFAFTFVAMLAMGYLSSKDFAEPALNWLAEAVNILGQGSFLFGAVKLRKAGLADLAL